MKHSYRRLNGYVLTYEPSSKYCMTSENWDGWVYEHILVMERRLGEIPDGFEVHHLDGDTENNRDDNLILLSKEDHTRLHNWLQSCDINLKELNANRMNSGKPKLFRCKECDKPLSGSQTTFCCTACQNRFSSKKPPVDELIGKTISEISSKFSVTPKTARKWFHSYGIAWQS